MQIIAETTNVKDVQVRVSTVMTVEQWGILLANLPERQTHPLYQFASVVRTAVDKVKNNMEIEEMK